MNQHDKVQRLLNLEQEVRGRQRSNGALQFMHLSAEHMARLFGAAVTDPAAYAALDDQELDRRIRLAEADLAADR